MGFDRKPLHVVRPVWAATTERLDVVDLVAWAGAAGLARGRAWIGAVVGSAHAVVAVGCGAGRSKQHRGGDAYCEMSLQPQCLLDRVGDTLAEGAHG